jgi:class 3 adenylate cyclase/tetratricopeptide (TPR) repeat protein
VSGPARCTACGLDQLPDSAFCHGCGRPLPAAGPAVLDGERKRITVLFIDAFGSIGLDDRLDAEQWREVMESFFAVVSTAAQHYGGTIDRLTGEGIKVLFGAPATLESHATQACHAALHIRDRLDAFAESFRARAGVAFVVRMGLHSGEVVFGRVGDGAGFTSQGHTAALASRMQQLAEPGSIYLTEDTAELVADYFDLQELGELSVRNANRRMRTFELRAAHAERTRLDAARERGLSPFLGRDVELATLERHLAALGPTESRIIGIVGEPGIGKSRLVEEFLARQATRGVAAHVTRCVEHARWIPFHANIPYIRRILGVSEHDDPVTARDRATRAVLAVDPALAESLPILFTVLGVADPSEASLATASSAPTRDLAHVLRRFVEHGDDGMPALFVIDDHHWMDAGADGAFGDLVSDPPHRACLVLVTYRRGHRRRWMRDARFSEIALRPLDDTATTALIQSLVGDDRSLGDLVPRILARAAGNPYFVEEIVRGLVDGGALSGARGTYRLARPDVEVSVPGSLHTVLAARVDQLDERAKTVLQTAAVIGREFSVELLAKLVALPAEELGRVVDGLEAGDFVHGFGWGERALYAFRHPLLRETVYRSLLGDRRRRIHVAIVEALSADDEATHGLGAAQIALHAEAAGDHAAAARWHAQAARHTAAWDPVQGLEQWRRVLASTNEGALDDELQHLRLAACEAIVRLAFHQSLPIDEASALIAEGDTLAARLGDRRAAAFLISARGNLRNAAGDLEGARALHETAYGRVAQLGDHEAAFQLGARLVMSERMAGELRAARTRADAILAGARDLPTRRPTTIARHHLEIARVAVLLDLGEIELASGDLAQVIATLRAANAPAELTWALTTTAFQIRHTGDTSPTLVGRVEEARSIAQSLRVPALLALTAPALAIVRLVQRRWDEARDLCLEALDAPIDYGHAFYCGVNPELQLSYAYLGLGEGARALLLAERALERACVRHSAIGQMDCLLAVGRLLRRAQDPAARERGRRFLLHGLALARVARSRPRLPLFWIELAGMALQSGDARGARARQRRAVRLLGRIDALGYVRRLTVDLSAPPSAR